MAENRILIIDFGGQYNQLVARRVREAGVYCEIYSYKTDNCPRQPLTSPRPYGCIPVPETIRQKGKQL